ncbi:MAG: acetyl-CoA C-acyltransferase, partial [Coxiella sp. (in: Bacteria)]
MASDEIVIINAYRTPIGSFNGYFKNTPTPELGSYPIHACWESAQITPDKIDALAMGCVLAAGLGQAPARQAALQADLPTSTPCVTVNKMCASALQAIIQSHDAIKAGTHNVMIAGGMENMT